MALATYQSTKDSGTAWLGTIPKSWDLRRIGNTFTQRNERVSDKDFQPLSVTKKGVVLQLDTAAKTNDGDNRKKVIAGDFVINSRSDRKGSSGLSELDGSVSLISTVIRSSELEPRYTHHLLRSYPFQEEFYRWGQGIVADLWSTNYQRMKNIAIPVPSAAEQKKVADFLDVETAKIDNLIAKQEKLLKLLEEKRRATITHAVTRGLDPEVKLKETNIPWLGKIPTHWDIARTARLFAVNKESNTKLDSLKPMKYGFGEIVPKQVDINENTQEELRRYLLIQPQDIMINGLNLNYDFITQRVAIVKTGGCMTPAYISLRKRNEGVVPEYYKYLLKALDSQKVLNGWGNGIRLTLNYSELKKKELAKPPTDEQLKIVEYLDKYIEKSDDLKQKIQEQIKLLKERRTSLISHAVTGKIKV